MTGLMELLPKLLSAGGQNQELSETAAKIGWARIAGGKLRLHAAPLRLRGGTLVVAVADAIWQKQMQAMVPEFLVRLNRVLQSDLVKLIEFRIDLQAVDAQRAQLTASSASPVSVAAQSLPPGLMAAAGSIRDQDLRHRFVRAAGNCIARREAAQHR